MIPFTADTAVHADKPASVNDAAPSIFDIGAQQTETKIPGNNNDAWTPPQKDNKTTGAPEGQPATQTAQADPAAPKLTREDYEFSARQTARLIEGTMKMASSGTNYLYREWKIRQLFKGLTKKEIVLKVEELWKKTDEGKLSEHEKGIMEEYDEIYTKYDKIEKTIPFSKDEQDDLSRALCDYQEYKKSTIDPKVMIWFTIGQILLKRFNTVIFA